MKSHHVRLALLLAGLALAFLPTASAQQKLRCWDECTAVAGCTNSTGTGDFCATLRSKCDERCGGRRWWGAIAYSKPDGAWGASWGWTEVEGAKKRAMARCVASKAPNCKVWIFFEDQCGAIAADGALTGWGTAADKGTAMRRAVQECRSAGGANCTVKASACSKMMDVTDAY